MWTAEGWGYGQLFQLFDGGISPCRHAHCTSLPWVKMMVHGDLDDCISQWLFLQTVVQCWRRALWLKTTMFEINGLKTPLHLGDQHSLPQGLSALT